MRSGRYRRTLVTKVGKVVVEVGRVYDRLRRRTLAPILVALGLRRRRYYLDLRLACAEEAARTTYGGAPESIGLTLSLWVPRRTIWNFVKEFGPWVEAGLGRVPLRETEGCHAADGTFVRGWRRGAQHEVNVAVRQRSDDHYVELVAVRVDGPARGVLDPDGVEYLVTDDAPAYTEDIARWHQLCQVHFLRHVRSPLTEERGLMTVPEREAMLRELGGVFGHLRASVEKHRAERNPWRSPIGPRRPCVGWGRSAPSWSVGVSPRVPGTCGSEVGRRWCSPRWWDTEAGCPPRRTEWSGSWG